MRRRTIPVVIASACVYLAISVGVRAEDEVEATAKEHAWRLSAGPMFRTIDGIEIRPGAYAGAGMVPNMGANRGSRINSLAGPANAYANRFYDDGFVFIDPGTGNPLSPLPDSTWFWGYQSAAQRSGATLMFHLSDREAQFSRRTDLMPLGGLEDDDGELGVFLQAERILGEASSFDVGVLLGWSYASFSGDAKASSFSDRQETRTYAVSIVDTYETMLNFSLPPINSPPYAGNYLGPGPLIPNRPTSRSTSRRLIGTDTYHAWNEICTSVDVDAHTFSLGAFAETASGPLVLNCAAGGTLNWIMVDAEHQEVLYGAANDGPPVARETWHDSESEDELEPGAFVQAGGRVPLGDRLSVSVFGRYDWIDDISGAIGPSTYEIDLSGASVVGLATIDL